MAGSYTAAASTNTIHTKAAIEEARYKLAAACLQNQHAGRDKHEHSRGIV